MPTSFAAFTLRDGYPRRIPDKGTFWHLGREVSKPVTGPARPYEHPELTTAEPPPTRSRGQVADEDEAKHQIEQRRSELTKEAGGPA